MLTQTSEHTQAFDTADAMRKPATFMPPPLNALSAFPTGISPVCGWILWQLPPFHRFFAIRDITICARRLFQVPRSGISACDFADMPPMVLIVGTVAKVLNLSFGIVMTFLPMTCIRIPISVIRLTSSDGWVSSVLGRIRMIFHHAFGDA